MKTKTYYKKPIYLFINSTMYICIRKGKFISRKQEKRAKVRAIKKAQESLNLNMIIFLISCLLILTWIMCQVFWGIWIR